MSLNSSETGIGAVALAPGVTHMKHAGYHCLQLSNVHGTLIVSMHGGQVLSWIPAGQRDVFWLSPQAKPAPAAIRGGVPVCWPWFSKQGMPSGAMQHGPVRNAIWKVVECEALANGNLFLRLEPDRSAEGGDAIHVFAKHLEVQLEIELGATLRMCLQTHNHGTESFALTQALHSYFAVDDVEQVQLEGVDDLQFDSRVNGSLGNRQIGAFHLQQACDNTYAQPMPRADHCYRLIDPSWKRQISLTTRGSQSAVVWNPGAVGALALADVPDTAWKDFLCVEAANAGPDVVVLAPEARYHLQQTLSCQNWPAPHTDKIASI